MSKIARLAPAAAIIATLASPLIVSAANDTQSTTINASLGSSISMTTSGTVSLSITPVSGGAQSTQTDTVTVNTNNATGFNLTIADSDATTTLVNGGNSISAHSGTQGSPSALANNSWGYRVVSIGGFGAGVPTPGNNITDSNTYAGVPATGSANTIKNTGTTASNDTTTVYYSVKADTSKPNGTYSDVVTYVATTNP